MPLGGESMLKERFRLMCLSKNGIDIRHYSLSLKQFIILISFVFLFFFASSITVVGITTKNFHNYRIAALENDREKLQRELLAMKSKVSLLGQQLSKLEVTSDELRTVANLPVIDNDTRQVGVGGPIYYSGLGFLNYPDNISETALEIRLDLDKLERMLHLEKSSLTEIASKLQERQEFMDCFPSINPVVNGRTTEKFGWRIHPMLNVRQFHKGIDIPARKGTTVLASGGGTVVLANRKYKPNVSYGKEVLIDHGNGYVTRYAHLDRILVRNGQKVKRWDPVGEVGETGQTTGPHLHYEVIKNGHPENPEYFILNNQ